MGKRNGIEALEYLYNNWDKIIKEAELAAQVKIVKDINDICRTSVDMYYEAFTPDFYERTESLYKAYKVKIHRNDLVIQLGSELMPDTHRASREYIYNMMFKEGWHGGGLNYEIGVSTPYWRTPAPYFSEWGERAPKTESPYTIIEKRVANYANRNIRRILNNSFKTTLNKYL